MAHPFHKAGKLASPDQGKSAPVHTRAGMGLTENAKATLETTIGKQMRRYRSLLDDEAYASVLRAYIAWRAREDERAAKRRVRCEARTTRKGTPCKNMSEPGRRRCKHHGGRSTGPKTVEGRERIAEAQRARWARWRAVKEARDLADASFCT